MSNFTYQLDQFQPWPALSVYVYGEAEIVYSWEGRDRDTGEPAGPGEIYVDGITIYAHNVGRDNEALSSDDPLYKAIEQRLLMSDSVVQSCIEDHESTVIGYDEN
jgi:hypothetical protein